MTREEALLFLPEQEDESLEDRFEQVLFETKQFLSSKAPVTKLLESKLKRLKQVQDAFVVLGGTVVPHQSIGLPFAGFVSDTVREVFDTYTQEKGRLKLQLLAQEGVEGIQEVMRHLLLLTNLYAEKWRAVDVEQLPVVTIGNEPDPMEIYGAIKEMEANGWASFTQINLLEANSPLKTEAKRLSLWLNFEENGGRLH